MPWKETCAMVERMKFISYYLTHEWAMTDLCRGFGISRKTGYKWVSRFIKQGVSGLEDRSRAPHTHSNTVSAEIEERVVSARIKHQSWGPAKIRTLLQRCDAETKWPAASTIGDILKRHGLVVPRRRSRKTTAYTESFLGCDYPNAVWSADFKGWFNTGDGTRCDPLTISDNYSRYLLCCQIVTPTGYDAVRPIFEVIFREYGLPVAIRTDNGPPFATTTLGALSKLSIWWLKLGIIPERIEPGKPSQNGRHERMHRTLKQETASPPKRTWQQQQKAFDRFLREYNEERPHQAINQQTPETLYTPSPRPYPLLLPQMTYPDDMIVRKVHHQGDLRWKGQQIYLSATLAGELVGLKQTTDRLWDIYFGTIKLAQLDIHQYRLIHLPKKGKKHKQNEEKEKNI